MSGPSWEPTNSERFELGHRSERGEFVLRNRSNLFWGSVSAWALFILAAALANKKSLTWDDPLSRSELTSFNLILFAVSIGTHILLVRPQVIIKEGEVAVRNPLRVFRFPLGCVDQVTKGLLGFSTLAVAGHRIRVIGLEESLYQTLGGGSDDIAELQGAIAFEASSRGRSESRDECVVHVRWDLSDRWLTILLFAWGVHGAMFLL